MKRFRPILLYLLLGAIINIVVAWGIALTIDVWRNDNLTIRIAMSSSESWEVSVWRAFGTRHFHSIRRKGPLRDLVGPSSTELGPLSLVPRWGHVGSVSEAFVSAPLDKHYSEPWVLHAHGWPCLTVYGEYRELMIADWQGPIVLDPHTRRGILDTPFPSWRQTGNPRVVSFIPIWPGFVGNTLFYAVLLWAAMFTPGALRRTIRRLRGQCERCAYDLRGTDHAACPECGEPKWIPS